MTNPYEPPVVDGQVPSVWSASRLYAFAGTWLAAAGLLHLVAMNWPPQGPELWFFDWSPIIVIAIGVLIVFRIDVAIVVARLATSFAILVLGIATVLILAGFGGGGKLTYGNVSVTDPTPWQMLLILFVVVGLTVIPPWWALQRALAGNK